MSQYVDATAYSLQSWDKKFNNNHDISLACYTDIARGGLSASGLNQNGNYIWFPSFEVNIPNQDDRLRVQNNILNENFDRPASKSDPC